MISRAVPICVFFVALLGSGAWLSEIQPMAGVPGLREKFAWLGAHADDYDTLFIGTSRIYRGIEPAVFDELTAAAGCPTHSFNIGMDGMTPPEDAYVFDQFMALRPKHLRWVFIETGTVRADFTLGVDENVRTLYWHDATRTGLACRALLTPTDAPLLWKKVLFGSAEDRQPLMRAVAHLRLYFTRTLNAGRGALLLRSWLASAPRVALSTIIGEAGDGFMPAGYGRPMAGADLADYQHRIVKPSRISFLDRDSQHSLDRMLTRLQAAGARPVLVIAPTVGRDREYPQTGCRAPVLDYCEVGKWPGLFQIDHRVDRGHLNPIGADLFTRAVAADFIDLARRSDVSR